MAHTLAAVSWTPFKKRYDLVLVSAIAAYLIAFSGVGLALFTNMTPEILLIRAFGTAALILLQFILLIGPAARLDRRWLPVLANRRHAGVSCFVLALIHGALVILTYHAGGSLDPLVSVFVSDAGMRASAFPFQAFGFVALLILFVMAATSHDFWLSALTAPVWKTLHMSVYFAWLLLIVHISFGVLQSETHPAYAGLAMISVLLISSLHLVAGWRERARDFPLVTDPAAGGFVDVCGISDLQHDRPRAVILAGDRVALVRFDGNRVAAVSGVCQHQNGPLAEGRYIDGCLTCPWHGFQYRLEDGRSPEPFTEKIPVFRVKIEGDRVLVHPEPHAPGTPVEPATIPGDARNA
jgi:nitrite reductase/ring-hydroxylating ferredoxin subunit/DMSO/TMAO reductase YedYZ heme-binding membrane subunit